MGTPALPPVAGAADAPSCLSLPASCTMLLRSTRAAPQALETAMLRKMLATILGSGLMLYGGTALAFTIITLPPGSEEEGSPSTAVTESTTLSRQVQPVTSAIRTQLLGILRQRRPQRISQAGTLVAANAYAETLRDVDFLLAAAGQSSSAGGSSG